MIILHVGDTSLHSFSVWFYSVYVCSFHTPSVASSGPWYVHIWNETSHEML